MNIRSAIRGRVQALVGAGQDIDFDTPAGDPGLFGPDSIAWRVHRDFSTMMIGGVSALLLQMLHPGALAGVWDHSNYRHDMQGRLKRTAQFIGGVTYASTPEAHRLIARVRAIHDGVSGTTSDGVPYSANDPDLLTWVHVAEARSFLEAYLAYAEPALPSAAQDRYFTETAQIARLLGATQVPTSSGEVEDYLRDIRPALRADARTGQVAKSLLTRRAADAIEEPFRLVAMDAGVDLLPTWAAAMHGFQMSAMRRRIVRVEARTLRSVMRWALYTGSASRSEARVRRPAPDNVEKSLPG